MELLGPYVFVKILVKHFGEPTVLTIGKAPTLQCTFNKIKKQGFYQNTIHYIIKHLNYFIEQGHRHVKRYVLKSIRFQNFRHASRTIKGIGTIQAPYKQRRSLQTDFVFSVFNKPLKSPTSS